MGSITHRINDRNYKYDLSGSVKVQVEGIVDGVLGALIKDSDIMLPSDIQNRYQKSVQTHSNVNLVPTTGLNEGAWVDVTGFNELGVNMIADLETAFAAYRLDLMWSQDGINVSAEEKTLLSENGARYRGAVTSIKAKYVKVRVMNKDSVAHVLSSWIYLKV